METKTKELLIIFLSLVLINNCFSQVDWNTAGNTTTGGEKLGSSSGNFNLDFYINNSNYLTLQTSGDLNIVRSQDGYKINDNFVLWYNSIPSSIFVGIGAGSSGTNNTFVGTDAGSVNNTGTNNTFVGYQAGAGTSTTNENTFVGSLAGTNNIARSNTFVGNEAGRYNYDGEYNSFFGQLAGQNNISGNNNAYFGHHAGTDVTGSNNTIMGVHAGRWGLNSNSNVIVGQGAMEFLNEADKNTVVGALAGRNHETGDENTFIGYRSGINTGTGYNNAFIGGQTGVLNGGGFLNTSLGYNSGPASGNLHHSIAIGADASVVNSYHMILGANNINVGIGLSGHTIGPRDKLEINSNDASASPGNSGLYLTDLTTASTVYNSAFPVTPRGVLSVDANGKVILVEDRGGDIVACVGLSNSDINYVPKISSITPTKEVCKSTIWDDGDVAIGATFTPQRFNVNGNINLMNNYDAFFLANERFLISDGNGSNTSVYLGLGAGPASGHNGSGNFIFGMNAGASLSDDESDNILIGIDAGRSTTGSFINDEASSNVFIGTQSGENNKTGSHNIFLGYQTGSGDLYDEEFQNIFIGGHTGDYNDEAGSSNVIIGHDSHLGPDGPFDNSVAIGCTTAIHANNSVAIGAWSNVMSDFCIVLGNTEQTRTLIGYNTLPTDPNTNNGFRLYVKSLFDNEAAYFDGDVYCTGSYLPSDSSLKNNFHSFDSQITNNFLDQITPATYFYDSINNPSLNLPSGIQYGLIADNVEALMPGLVREVTAPPLTDSLGNITIPEKTFKALNYTGIIPFLVQGIKNQQEVIDSLMIKDSLTNRRIDQLESLINNCCMGTGHRLSNPAINVELSNGIILNQNDPNPFAEETRITYFIPESCKDAKIIFFDTKGNVLRTVKISERGEGQMNVYASNLTSGIYSYSLVVDGNLIETKKMVCSK